MIDPSHERSGWLGTWLAWNPYLVAVLAILVALGLKQVLNPIVDQSGTPFLLFYTGVMVSAWYGGFKPGILATVTSCVVVAFFCVSPEDPLFQSNHVLFQISVFFIEGILISAFSGAMHAARRAANESRQWASAAFQESQDAVGELARAQDSIRASETRFRRLVEADIIGVFLTTEDGRIVRANDAFLRMVGHREKELQLQPLYLRDITPPEELDMLTRLEEEVQRTGKCTPCERDLLRDDGQHVPVLLGAARLDGKHERAIYLALDQTERRQFELELEQARDEAEDASRAKSEFLANVSHELRTPMNAIIGMTDLALREPLSPVVRDYLQTSSDSAHSLLQLVNDILDFSKIGSGKFQLDETVFRLRELFDETMKSLAVRAYQKGLEITFRIDNDVPDRLIGDALRLRQVVTNLVGNGIKFTEKGEVGLTIEVESRTSREVVLHFTVSDTGIGISSADQARIFAPFTQADASATRHFAGTGLGLAICVQLTSVMGGRLWVDSEPGTGSRFHFTARFQRAVDGDPQKSPRISPTDQLRSVRVLAVDDNATNRRILEDSLTSWSMIPTMVSDGAAALEVLQKAADQGETFPLAIIDSLMPELDGFTLAERIREKPVLAKATILMLSAADRQVFENRCRDIDFVTFLEKPVAQSELLEAILKAFQLKSTAEVRIGSIGQSNCALKILVAEDTPANQKLVMAILQQRGHGVTVARNGKEAVDLAQQQRFDLILMDVQMPILDGLQATRTIRATEGFRKSRIPIVAMTAHALRGDRERCLSAGMDAYIAKPIDADRMIELVESLAGDRSSQEGEIAPAMTPQHAADDLPDPALKQSSEPILRNKTAVFEREPAILRLGGSEELFVDMIRFFLEDSPGLLADIETAVGNSDAETVHRAAHSLKGLAANFDAHPTVSAAQELEALGRTGELSEAPAVLDRLKVALANLREALQAELPAA